MNRLNQIVLAFVLLGVAVWMNYNAIRDFLAQDSAEQPPNVEALLAPVPSAANAAPAAPAAAASQEPEPTGDVLIQTIRLPLRMHTDFVAGNTPLAVGAGSIQAIRDKILIMDRLGAFYLWDGHAATQVHWPALPNHRHEFEAYWKQDASINDLRTHDIKFDAEQGVLYASFEAFNAEQHGLRLTIARLPIDAGTMAAKGDWKVLFQGDTIVREKGTGGVDAGGKLLIAAHTLYFSAGDYVQSDFKNMRAAAAGVPPAQDPHLSFGKTFSMPLGASAATLFTLGHRNPQGLAMRADGTLLETEHGPRGGDKLNVLVAGKNYGWPYLSEGSRYGTYDRVDDATQQHGPFKDALFNFVPGIAPTALLELSDFDPAWNGDIVIGSLKARSLYRLRIKEGRVILSEPIWIGLRVRDMVEHAGKLILWTDDGSLVTLDVDRQQLASRKLTDTWMTRNINFAGNCAYCHEGQGASAAAPTLDDVYGRPVGGAAYGRYTKALQSKPGVVWDEGTLYAFIKYPSRFAPGTAMPDTDLPDAKIHDIIQTLKENAQYGKPHALSHGLAVAP